MHYASGMKTSPLPSGRAGLDLFLVSGLVLFLELACIRWFPAHVLYLTFFTNCVLLAAFVGMSIGCLLADRPTRLLKHTPLWLAAALGAGLLVSSFRDRVEQYVSVANQENPEVVFFGSEAGLLQQVEFRFPLEIILGVFFVLIALVMVGPGQEMGRAFNRVPNRGRAYALNLLGSLAGILLFAVGSMYQLPPVVWFGLSALGLAVFLARGPERPSILSHAALATAVALSLLTSGVLPPREGHLVTHWSPYYRVDYVPGRMVISTNQIAHQQIETRAEPSIEVYPLPYLFQRDVPGANGSPAWPAFKRVLIIGAGSGNDLSRALQWCGPDARIDAVEIDPVIHKLGVAQHPDRPYADPRVSVHLNDGRNFLRKAPDAEYDLVVFALIDSLVLQSGYSNLRLESYLFTAEAFRDVRRVLKPTGVAAVYNFFRQGWIAARLRDELRGAFETDPVMITNPPKDVVRLNDFDRGFTVFFAGAPPVIDPLRSSFGRTGNTYWYPWAVPVATDTPNGFRGPDDAPPPLTASGFHVPMDMGGHPVEPKWVRFRIAELEASPADLPQAKDDWPFLYTRRPSVPEHTLRGIAIMVILSLGLWWAMCRAAGCATCDSTASKSEWGLLARSFFLGAGFMLVETKAVVHMALLFGGTWTVNTVVFAAVLLMSLAGNLWAMKVKPRSLTPYYALLFISLALNVAIPIDSFLGLSPTAQIVGACLLAFAPVACAGVIFAASFARSERPNRMFGANVAGALVGGLAENASMLLGFRYLILVAAAFYLLSGLGGNRSQSPPETTP
jgi:SAM-dependent methyltransferase